MNSTAPPVFMDHERNQMFGMLQLHHSESELSPAAVLHRAVVVSKPSFGDKFNQLNQVNSKFNAGHLKMFGAHCEQARNKANTNSHQQPPPSATLCKIERSANAKMNDGSRSKSDSSTQRESQTNELKQWHKLMDDYERLQFIASSRARNKLIESSSSSESSLDSSSSFSQASTVYAIRNQKDTHGDESPQKPSMIAMYQSTTMTKDYKIQEAAVAIDPSLAIHNKPDKHESRAEEASLTEVGQCLDELVEAVVVSSARATAVNHQSSSLDNQASSYKSFKLHEAILAKTHSSSSATATSASDDSSSGDETYSGKMRHDSMEVEFLCSFKTDSVYDHSRLIRQARDLSCQTESTKIAAVVDMAQHMIRQIDENNNNCDSIDLKLVDNCLLDDRLVVWLIRSDKRDTNDNSMDGIDDENALDLDDIALALNEPIAIKPNGSSSLSAIIWRCINDSNDAVKLRDAWIQYRSTCNNAVEMHQIEVKPSEVELNSATAEQMKCSGLFVLQTDRKTISAENGHTYLNLQPGGSVAKDEAQKRRPESNGRSDRIDSQDLIGDSKEQQLRRASSQAGAAADSNLAYYYRSVASRVISSGSSRFKNFTLGSGQTLAKGARRLSMALNHQLPRSSSPQTSVPRSTTNVNGAVELPRVKPRTSVLKRDTCEPQETPHDRLNDHERSPRSILKKNRSEISASGERVTHQKNSTSNQTVSNHDTSTRSRSLGGVQGESVSSKHTQGMQEQLERLRAGSTSSLANRTRQRRPALLLPPSAPQDDDFNPGGTELKMSPKVLPNVSTSSPIDGTVRAKVSMSHLRRSASMKVLAAESKLCETTECSQAQHDCVQATRKKRSEFDPRSLQKLSCSETARALRQGADNEINYEADQKENRPLRERALRRRSMANLAELKFELDQELEDEEQEVVCLRRCPEVSSSVRNIGGGSSGQTLSKSFNMLRQSFTQKNLSAILNFATGRQSLRVKSSPDRVSNLCHSNEDDDSSSGNNNNNNEEEEANLATRAQDKLASRWQSELKRADESIGRLDQQKLEAIKVAEANLLAAKQLKQQAQRMREQQRRNEHHQQQSSIVDSAAILFYNQQIQKQQQQLVYQAQQRHQQQYAFSNGYNQHLFDPMALYQQQQQQQQLQLAQQFQIQQQRQQQQLAYFSNHSAHFMAAAQHQMVALVQAPVTSADHLYSVGRMQAVGSVSVPFIGQQHHQNQTALINHQQQLPYLQAEPNNELRPNQHFIPMSVNHHSSFNIVYTAAAAAAAAANHQQQQLQIHNPQGNQFNIVQAPYLAPQQPATFVDNHRNNSRTMLQVHQQQPSATTMVDSVEQPVALRSKHCSLGASVRKTMRFILRNGKSVVATDKQATAGAAGSASKSELGCGGAQDLTQNPSKPLKSALKISSATIKEQQHLLNSEGSDGDASSSSESALNSRPAAPAAVSPTKTNRPAPTSSKQRVSPPSSSTCSPCSSDSSLASTGTTQNGKNSATLTRRDLERLRRDFIASNDSIADDQQLTARRSLATLSASNSTIASQRKNVTFSTKLTSIL